jgi:hypothetical protein
MAVHVSRFTTLAFITMASRKDESVWLSWKPGCTPPYTTFFHFRGPESDADAEAEEAVDDDDDDDDGGGAGQMFCCSRISIVSSFFSVKPN